MKSKTVLPVCVITNPSSIKFTMRQSDFYDTVVVRAGDFLSSNGKNLQNIYYTIVGAGGINSYLGIPNRVVLSLIMNDQKCSGVTPEIISRMLNELKISCCTTFDEATYLGEETESFEKILKIQEMNHMLIKLNPKCKFLGVVKGCTDNQIIYHATELLNVGITGLIFHAGDYVSHGNEIAIRTATRFFHFLHIMTQELYVYGIGSKRMIQKFHEADYLITLNQVIEPNRGIFTDRFGRVFRNHHYVPDCNLNPWIPKTNDDDITGINTFKRICHDFEHRNDNLSKQMTIGFDHISTIISSSLTLVGGVI